MGVARQGGSQPIEVARSTVAARPASAVGTRLCSIISITSRSPLGGILCAYSQIIKRSIEALTVSLWMAILDSR